MRTPLASILFFVIALQKMMSQFFKNDKALLKKAEKSFNLITRQIRLMQTFVDDLLDFRQIKEGVFKLVYMAFDPNKTLKQVYDMFAM